VLAAFKGIVTSGLEIPHKEAFFPENIEETVNGSHIERYANLLKTEDPEKYEQVFSGYIKKNNVNPLKISKDISNTLKQIEESA
jgi:large subunit ribosomal protein L18